MQLGFILQDNGKLYSMHPLEKETLTNIQQQALLNKGETVVVGVSAGPDSMALLHVLAALRIEMDLSVVAVYVDHGLRPTETPQEASLVQGQVGLLGIQCKIDKVDVQGYGDKLKLSLEHAARILRYEYLEKVAREYNSVKIAVGHTADDQAEEVLLRLIRGTGRKGLSGMDMLYAGSIIRPFLAISKEQLLTYLADKKIPFLEDSSNKERVYLRNKIRLDLIPYIAQNFNPNIKETLRQTAAILKEEEILLEELTSVACNKIIIADAAAEEKYERGTPNPLVLVVDRLLEESRAIQRRVAENVCWMMHNRPSFRKVEQILDVAFSGDDGAVVHLAQGLRVNKKVGQLIFSYPKGKTTERGDLTDIEEDYFQITLPNVGTYSVPEIGKKIVIESFDAVPPESAIKSQDADYFDFDAISFPLCVRSWQSGDQFHPLGAPGRKKVSDFLTDSKVPRQMRWQVPVLTSSDNKILALLGVRIDHTVRLSEKTKKVLMVKVEFL